MREKHYLVLLNTIISVQECDATGDATSTSAGLIKIIPIILLTLTILVYKKPLTSI